MSFPVLLSTPLRCLTLHALLIGSEAMAAASVVALPGTGDNPRFSACRRPPRFGDAKKAAGSPTPNVAPIDSTLETSGSKLSTDETEANKPSSRPPLYKYWKLNIQSRKFFLGGMCSPIWVMLPRLGSGSCGGGGDAFS